jgi:hypothetical protein
MDYKSFSVSNGPLGNSFLINQMVKGRALILLA